MAWFSLDEALNDLNPIYKSSEKIVSGTIKVIEYLADSVANNGKKKMVACFDGYLGVDFNDFIRKLSESLKAANIDYYNVASAYKSSDEIEALVNPALTKYPDFGYVIKGALKDFFDLSRLDILKTSIKNSSAEIIICYGIGAGLLAARKFYDFIFYIDITREALVKRIEEDNVLPFCAGEGSLSAKLIDKRLLYVDYWVLNNHKRRLLKSIDGYIETNSADALKYVSGKLYDAILSTITEIPFRLKPVYMPGVWGGQEMKKLRGLPDSMLNCAFALEVIPWYQSVRIKLGDAEIETPFYNLVWKQPKKLLGAAGFKKFGYHFPITQNYDDTCQGGSLAIQDHPTQNYIRKKFNEKYRRDESYYVVKAYPGAKTYHGLKEDVDIAEFYKISREAEKQGVAYDHDAFVNSWESVPGDLLLIPGGTVHASGPNQLVLEIDSDPSKCGAEYTFHIYDFLRLNTDGTLRDIHLEHAFNVLKTARRRNWVRKNLKQAPRKIRGENDWAEYLIGDYHSMYYKVHRFEFQAQISDNTNGNFHILTLVEGDEVAITTQKHPNFCCTLKFTETVIIPADTGEYVITNRSNKFCKMTKALLT